MQTREQAADDLTSFDDDYKLNLPGSFYALNLYELLLQ
jgi:hypothetical protein